MGFSSPKRKCLFFDKTLDKITNIDYINVVHINYINMEDEMKKKGGKLKDLGVMGFEKEEKRCVEEEEVKLLQQLIVVGCFLPSPI